MRKLIVAVPIFLLFASAALAQAPKSAGSNKLDPCALIAKAEIQAIVGASVTDGQPNRSNASVCDYKVAGSGVVSFLVRQNGPGESADKIMAELKKRNIKVAEAQGVGDRSFFAEMGYGMIQLNSFKGPNYVILTMLLQGAPAEKQKTIAAKVMQKVLSKM